MPRTLRYSERKRLAEAGALEPLSDSPSEGLRNAVVHVYRRAMKESVGGFFDAAFKTACAEFFGWNEEEINVLLDLKIKGIATDEFLDLVEIFVEQAEVAYPRSNGMYDWKEAADASAEERMNNLFERHRFGYRFEGGELRKIGSPALDEVIVGPALLAVKQPGWEEVERSFKEAIQHQRGTADENDDALTAANAAVEAALKAAGFKGANLGPLAKDFKKSPLIPAELKSVPEALDLLLGRAGALRSSYGDSHGKASGSNSVPQALVDLAINWAGAFIVYLSNSLSTE